jgi:prepilin-type N-terminal cleavage/methylation domain-containing protein
MSAALRRRLARLRESDDGVTLVELLVVVGLLAIVLAVAQESLILTNRLVGDTAVRNDESQQAKTAVEGISQTMRTAILPKLLNGTCTGCDVAAFISGNAKSVSFYANINNDLVIPTAGTTTFGPRRVTYTLGADGTLTETLQTPNVHSVSDFNFAYCTPGPSCPVRTRILAASRDHPGAVHYYNKSGGQLSVPLEGSTANLQSVDSIDILLTVKPRGGSKAPRSPPA